ncbi:MAG: serine hydrolase domain-containing protein [Actinomycetaceae bacterium]|nr:serine hydrolase domain-containing protein [Actinomycetaceae bacterium]
MRSLAKRSLASIALIAATVLSACAGGGGGTSASPPPITSAPMSGAAQSSSQSGATSRELTAENVNTWLDGYMPAALESQKIAGATVSVVKDGKVLTTRGFGYADTGNGGEGKPVPVDPEKHLFRVGSISKIPTSIAVMQLVEQGKVDLDADISTYVDVPIKRRFDAPITVRHLLTHTAGFEGHSVNAGTGTESYDLEKGVLTDPPEQVYEPGSTPAYSNYGLTLAGFIVQKVSGQRFEDYVKANIFDPLGMDSSTYEDPLPENLQSRLAKAYPDSSQSAAPLLIPPQPAGSMTTSASDFALFMNAQLSKDPRILKVESWEQMSMAAPNEKLGDMHKGDRVGIGLLLGQRNGHRTAGHSGGHPPFFSHYEVYPEQNIGIFISMNSAGTNPAASVEAFPRRFADQFLPDQTPAIHLSADERKAHVQQVAGTYEIAGGMLSTFLVQMHPMQIQKVSASPQGNLILSGVGEPTEFEEIEPYVWQHVDGKTRISADIGAGGVRLNYGGAGTMLPESPVRALLTPLSLGGQVVIAAVALLWMAGGARRMMARHYGAPQSPPLPWNGRLARMGGILAGLMPMAWLAVISTVMAAVATGRSSDWMVRGVQGLQLLAVAAIVPAVWDVVRAVREKRGWPRILVSVALVLGLLAMACWAVLGNALNPDISY